MASRSGVNFPVGLSVVAGLLDGILQAQVRSRQFKLEDAAEARRERMFSLQERTLEDAERRREEAEFPPPPTTRGIGQEVEQSLRERFLAANQAAQGREDVLQQQAFKTGESERDFRRDIAKLQFGIEQRGAQTRLNKQTPGAGTVKPEEEKTITQQEAESAKATGSFAKSIRNSGAIPGDPNLTPAELDFRFGEDFLNTAVAQASAGNLRVADVVKDSMATHWSKAVTDPSIENDYFDSLPRDTPQDNFDPIAPDVRLRITKDTKQSVVGARTLSRIEPDFIGIPEAGTLDLEDLALIFITNNATEQDFRDFVKEVLIKRVFPTVEQRGEDFKANLGAGIESPTTGGTGLGSLK